MMPFLSEKSSIYFAETFDKIFKLVSNLEVLSTFIFTLGTFGVNGRRIVRFCLCSGHRQWRSF